MKDQKRDEQFQRLKAAKTGQHLSSSNQNLKRVDNPKGSLNRNLDIERLTNRLIKCLEIIDDLRNKFDDLGKVEFHDCQTIAVASGPWNEEDQERRILRQRHVERRHQLLSHVLADLLDVVSREAGLDQIDKLLYPYKYSPEELARAIDLR